MIYGPLHFEIWHSLVILVNRRGETLFDDRRDMRTWATESEAAAWLREHEPGVEIESGVQDEWAGLPLLEGIG